MADRVVGRKVNLEFLKSAGLLRSVMSLPENRMQLYAIVDLYYSRCVHTLFQPSALIKSYLEEYEQQLGDGIRIGVHLRMGEGHSDWKDSRPFMSMKRAEELIKMVAGLIQQQRRKHGDKVNIRLFVSTDSSEMEKVMRKRFPGIVVTTRKLRRSHVGGVKSTKYDDQSVIKAILDVMLLGKCEFLFLTKRSGYSKIGLYYADENTSFRLVSPVCCAFLPLSLFFPSPFDIDQTMEEDNYQQQQDEMNALEAIYADEFER